MSRRLHHPPATTSKAVVCACIHATAFDPACCCATQSCSHLMIIPCVTIRCVLSHYLCCSRPQEQWWRLKSRKSKSGRLPEFHEGTLSCCVRVADASAGESAGGMSCERRGKICSKTGQNPENFSASGGGLRRRLRRAQSSALNLVGGPSSTYQRPVTSELPGRWKTRSQPSTHQIGAA